MTHVKNYFSVSLIMFVYFSGLIENLIDNINFFLVSGEAGKEMITDGPGASDQNHCGQFYPTS